MKKLNFKDEEITLDNVEEELNRLFYEIRSLSNASNITKENEELLLDCLDGSPKGITGVQLLMAYLTGSSYGRAEIDGKSEYVKMEPIDPKIIYAKTNQLIDLVNDTLGVKETDEPRMSEEETKSLNQAFETAYKKALEEGIKKYYELLASKPSQKDIEEAIDIQFRDITPNDITINLYKNGLGDLVEKKQIPLSKELAKVLDCEYLFEAPLHETPDVKTVLEQVTVHEKDKETITYECSRYNSMGNIRGSRVIKQEEIKKIIEDRFHQITEKGTIQPSDALKNALHDTTIGQTGEATIEEHTNEQGEQTHDEQ